MVKKILPFVKYTAKQFVKLCITQKLNNTLTMNTKNIGWIGLGNMGIPMSQQLIKAGYPVTVYNRSKEK